VYYPEKPSPEWRENPVAQIEGFKIMEITTQPSAPIIFLAPLVGQNKVVDGGVKNVFLAIPMLPFPSSPCTHQRRAVLFTLQKFRQPLDLRFPHEEAKSLPFRTRWSYPMVRKNHRNATRPHGLEQTPTRYPDTARTQYELAPGDHIPIVETTVTISPVNAVVLLSFICRGVTQEGPWALKTTDRQPNGMVEGIANKRKEVVRCMDALIDVKGVVVGHPEVEPRHSGRRITQAVPLQTGVEPRQQWDTPITRVKYHSLVAKLPIEGRPRDIGVIRTSGAHEDHKIRRLRAIHHDVVLMAITRSVRRETLKISTDEWVFRDRPSAGKVDLSHLSFATQKIRSGEDTP
jgi:hypothetical protein